MAQVEQHETLIIGGGQAGLSVGYHLQRHGRSFVILEAGDRIGDSWRARWDSLRLYSPASRDGLPGMPFPAAKTAYPTKDEMGDYLESYAQRFELPARSGVSVVRVCKNGVRFVFILQDGAQLERLYQRSGQKILMGASTIKVFMNFQNQDDALAVSLAAGKTTEWVEQSSYSYRHGRRHCI